MVARARFEPLDGSRPLGAADIGDYRGALEIVSGGDSVAVVNDVSVEDYVDGISEVPSEWPAAALEAQAIAARTYLLHHAAAPSPAMAALGAQICADQDCQVYRGLSKEQAPDGSRWVAAVRATKGQVLLYGGRPINAMYSSSNGGRTVAGGEPYLQSVPDPDDAASPLDQWEADIDATGLAHALNLPGPVDGISRSGDTVTVSWSVPAGGGGSSAPAGSAPGPEPPSTTAGPVAGPAGAQETASPANTTLPLPGTSSTTAPATTTPAHPTTSDPPDGTAPTTSSTTRPPSNAAPGPDHGIQSVPAADFTRRVNAAVAPAPGRDVFLPSDRFAVGFDGSIVKFTGSGFGHGVGMSQYGALAKARRGLSASDILAFYYNGIRPTALPATAMPSDVRVDVADGLAHVDVTGRFRLVDEHDNVLITVGDGPWRVEPAPGGLVRVILPQAYQGRFGVSPVSVDPPVVLPGAKVKVRFTLPVPGLASVSATPPGAAPVTTDLGITASGAHEVQVPPAASVGTYTLRIAAAAGAGRQADSVLELHVGSPPPGVPDLTRFSSGLGAQPGGSARRSMAAGVAVAGVLLFAVGAIAAIAIRGRRRAGWGRSSTLDGSPTPGR